MHLCPHYCVTESLQIRKSFRMFQHGSTANIGVHIIGLCCEFYHRERRIVVLYSLSLVRVTDALCNTALASLLGALVVTHAMLRRLTSWRCIIYYYTSVVLVKVFFRSFRDSIYAIYFKPHSPSKLFRKKGEISK